SFQLDGQNAVIADVAGATGQPIVVDGGCATTIDGLAIYSLLTPGDPDRLSALEGGRLVGHLHGCPGTFARAARLPRSVVAVPATIAPSLVDAARADLLA